MSSALDQCVSAIIGKIPSLSPEKLSKAIAISFGASKEEILKIATRIKETERPGCPIHGSASIIVYGQIGAPINLWYALRDYVSFLMWEREGHVVASSMGVTYEHAHAVSWVDIYDALASYLISFFPCDLPPLEDDVFDEKSTHSALSSTSNSNFERAQTRFAANASLDSSEGNSQQSVLSSSHPVEQVFSKYSGIRTSNPPILARHNAFLEASCDHPTWWCSHPQCERSRKRDSALADTVVAIVDLVFPLLLTPEMLKLTKNHLIDKVRDVVKARLGTDFDEFVTISETWQLTLENTHYVHELRQIIRGLDQHEVDSVKREELEHNIKDAIVRMTEPKSADIKDGSIFHELCWIVGPCCLPVAKMYAPTVDILASYVVKMFVCEVGDHISIV